MSLPADLAWTRNRTNLPLPVPSQGRSLVRKTGRDKPRILQRKRPQGLRREGVRKGAGSQLPENRISSWFPASLTRVGKRALVAKVVVGLRVCGGPRLRPRRLVVPGRPGQGAAPAPTHKRTERSSRARWYRYP